MSELIVLGLIPGTHIQITFILWVLLVTFIVVSGIISIARRTHVLRNWIISVRLLMLMRQATIARP
jgi:hypothetical protein